MGAPAVIGGNGYRWRGRAIRTIRKGNSTCVTMPRKDSTVMAPVGVAGESQYKITITAAKNSGNGALLVNFFGGKRKVRVKFQCFRAGEVGFIGG